MIAGGFPVELLPVKRDRHPFICLFQVLPNVARYCHLTVIQKSVLIENSLFIDKIYKPLPDSGRGLFFCGDLGSLVNTL